MTKFVCLNNKEKVSKYFVTSVFFIAFLNILIGSGRIPSFVNYIYSTVLILFMLELFILYFYSWYTKKIIGVNAIICGIIMSQLVSTIINNNISMECIYNIVVWPLIFIISYNFSYKGYMKVFVNKEIIGIILASAWLVYVYRNYINNTIYYSYYAIACIPFVFENRLKNSKIINLISILSIIVITLWSYKRAGILLVFVGIFAYFFIDAYVTKKYKGRKVIGVASLIIIIYILIIKFGENFVVYRRFLRLNEDKGSNRTQLWERCLKNIDNSSLRNILFGKGYKGVSREMFGYAGAHNDFIEILYDYGLIGVFFIILFLGSLLYRIYCAKKIKEEIPTYISCLSIMFLMSMVSFLIWQSFIMNLIALFLGYKVAIIDKNRQGRY